MMCELSNALLPVYYWSKLFGIPFECGGRHPTRGSTKKSQYLQSKWNAAISLITFILNIGGNIAFLAFVHETSLAKSSTRNWNFVINRVNCSLITMAIHSILLFRTCFRWPKLLQLFSSGERSLDKSNKKNYSRLKNVSIICSAYVFMELVIALVLLGSKLASDEIPTKKKILHIFSDVLPATVRSFGAAWTCFSAYLTCTCWSHLASHAANANLRKLNTNVKTENLRQRFFLALDITAEYQRCFGAVIILLLIQFSVWFTNTSFFLLTNIQHRQTSVVRETTVIVEMLKETGLFCALAYVPSFIQKQAVYTFRGVRKWQSIDTMARFQVDILKAEILINTPKFRILGMVDVNLSLIPSLIGFTLSYVVILYQFKNSE